MKSTLTLIVLLHSFITFSQTIISGKVTDNKGKPIVGANVYLDGTYDGASTNIDGKFSFTSSEKNTQTLVVSFLSFETFYQMDDVSKMKNLRIQLQEDFNTLETVEINAGNFDAGAKSKSVRLTPIDIVTTASSAGDIFGALQTMPGTSTNGEDGRLFVRGGDADETKIFIDGMYVASPFLSTGNFPTRGRFSSFLFKGMSFSTGGYSAEYGQALSSVFDMNTIDQPDQEKTDIGFMTLGLSIGNTQIWNKNSFSVNASYINLAPYQWIVSNRDKWNKPYESISSEMVFRHKFNENGLLKLYTAFSFSEFDVIQNNINFENGFNVANKNRNLYFNASYKQRLKNSWTIFSGLSYTNDKMSNRFEQKKIATFKNSAHAKVKVKKKFSNFFKVNIGTEYYLNNFDENYLANKNYNLNFNSNIFGSFLEADIFFNKNFATKVGIRAENSELSKEFTVSPRISLAYKLGKHTQFSLAYGQFYQNPKDEYLKFNHNLRLENSTHFIANYQYQKDNQLFRIEAYKKGYHNLVKFNTNFTTINSTFNNQGNGYANGIDLFWRDKKNIKNLEYWCSYSYLDTQRNFKNYPQSARPNFSSKHNASLVTKYWVNSIRANIGATYNFASGRSYTNPNINGFLNQQTINYNSLSLSIAHLISQQKILYASVNNVLGTKNVFGYRYKNTANTNGIFESQPILPNTDTFFVIGFFWTISDDKTSNQLDNL